MAMMEVGQRLVVTFYGRLCGQRTLNTFWYQVASVPGGTSTHDAFIGLHATMGLAGGVRPAFRACTPSNYLLDQVWYQVITPVRLRKDVFAVTVNGLFDDVAHAPNLQASITRGSELASKEHIGGIRIPIGTTSQSSSEGFITSALKIKLDALALTMTQNIINASGPAATFRPLIGAAGDGAARICEVAFAQDTTRVLRRRTVGLGI